MKIALPGLDEVLRQTSSAVVASWTRQRKQPSIAEWTDSKVLCACVAGLERSAAVRAVQVTLGDGSLAVRTLHHFLAVLFVFGLGKRGLFLWRLGIAATGAGGLFVVGCGSSQ